MSESHVAVCAACNNIMTCQKVGVTLEIQVKDRPYYIIQADAYKCNGCGAAVYSEFGRRIMHYHPDFQKLVDAAPERQVVAT